MTDSQQNGFGIYVHWPFCQAKCPYCDFNSHVRGKVNQREWAKAFVLELERYHWELPDRVVKSVFFGGGTPSLMEPELVETILTCITELWKPAHGIEITMEANPTSVEAGRFREYRGAGVNRISLGIQSLNDQDLSRLGRLHSANEALIALEIAQNTFARVSFDLIYARQDQSLNAWRDELTMALSFGTEHLSLYQLTIEDGTAFGRLHKAGRLTGLPVDDLSADLYELTQELCGAAGMPAYEVSNHAKPSAQSQHNLIYWRGGEYLGVGPGAHGRISIGDNRYATETNLLPESWLTSALSGNAESLRDSLKDRDIALEYLMMSIRLSEGVDLVRLNFLDNTLLNIKKLAEMEHLGFVTQSQNRLVASASGRMVLNRLIPELLND